MIARQLRGVRLLAAIMAGLGVSVTHAQTSANQQLHDGVETRDIRLVNKALREGANPAMKDRQGVSPLMKAARMINVRAVHRLAPLVGAAGNVNAVDKDGATALDHLSKNKRLRSSKQGLAIYTMLIKHGARFGVNTAESKRFAGSIGCSELEFQDEFCKRVLPPQNTVPR